MVSPHHGPFAAPFLGGDPSVATVFDNPLTNNKNFNNKNAMTGRISPDKPDGINQSLFYFPILLAPA